MSESLSLGNDEKLYDFNEFSFYVDELIKKVDFSTLPQMNGEKLIDILDQLIQSFRYLKDSELRKPPQLIYDFGKLIRENLSNDVIKNLLYYFPNSVPSNNNLIKLILFFIYILKESRNGDVVLHWAMLNFPSKYFEKCNSDSIYNIIVGCPCHLNKNNKIDINNFIWASLNINNILSLDYIENSCNVLHEREIHVSEIEKRGDSIIILNSKKQVLKVLYPHDKKQCIIWENSQKETRIPFPLFITSIEKPIPNHILVGLYEGLTCDDFLIVRVLTHFSVVEPSNGIHLCEALFNIFSYAGRINGLLTLLAGDDFGKSSVSKNSVLRTNSQLTCMFKFFYQKYGKEYYNSFLKNIINYISKNDMPLREPLKCDLEKVRNLLFTVLGEIIHSGPHIPPQIRHFASILKDVSIARFNDKKATFNTLSAFFSLRFITPIIANPLSYDEDFDNVLDLQKTNIPFSQILQTPLNLMKYHGKYMAFSDFNSTLEKFFFPKLYKFILSISEVKESPVYEVPSKEGLYQSLEVVMEYLNNYSEKFRKKYKSYLKSKKITPAGWATASFLIKFFKSSE